MNFQLLLILLVVSVWTQEADELLGNPMEDILSELEKSGLNFEDNPFIKLLAPLLGRAYNANGTSLNIDPVELEQKIKEYQEQTFYKWNNKMIDFQPDDLLTFELDSQEILCEEIKAPTMIRGAFFLPPYTNTKVKLTIKSPKNETLYKKDAIEDVFEIGFKEAGEYRFIFTNKNSDPLMVTFAVDVHDSHNDYLEFKDLDPMDQRIEALHIAIRDSYFQTKLSQKQYNDGTEMLQSTHDKLLAYTIIETISILAVTLWQIIYIKRILSNQRMI